MASGDGLSRRERQIMDVIYARSEASANDVLAAMADAPSNTAVRTFLRILEDKGHLTHRKVGREYVYRATRPRRKVGQSAMRRVVETFFEGSLEKAVAAHLADPRSKLSPAELTRLMELIRQRGDKDHTHRRKGAEKG